MLNRSSWRAKEPGKQSLDYKNSDGKIHASFGCAASANYVVGLFCRASSPRQEGAYAAGGQGATLICYSLTRDA